LRSHEGDHGFVHARRRRRESRERPGAHRRCDERAQHLHGPHNVEPAAFNGAKFEGGALSVTLPAKSVVMLELN